MKNTKETYKDLIERSRSIAKERDEFCEGLEEVLSPILKKLVGCFCMLCGKKSQIVGVEANVHIMGADIYFYEDMTQSGVVATGGYAKLMAKYQNGQISADEVYNGDVDDDDAVCPIEKTKIGVSMDDLLGVIESGTLETTLKNTLNVCQ